MNNAAWTKEEVNKLIRDYKRSQLSMYEVALEWSQKHERSHNAVNGKLHELKRRGMIEPRAEDKPPVKILLVDIETLPLVVYSWGIYRQFLSPDFIVKDWCVLSWAAKWLTSDVVVSDVLTPKEVETRNDRRILANVWKLLSHADIVVTHNGARFDRKKLNARFIHWDMMPPDPYKLIDTLKASRAEFAFTSNKQSYLGKELGGGEKLEMHFDDWRECDQGNPEALKHMREYNEVDVTTLQGDYMRLRPWMPNHPNVTMYDGRGECPVCGGEMAEVKRYPTQRYARKAVRCVDCGAVGRRA